jgi:hypothetical protein
LKSTLESWFPNYIAGYLTYSFAPKGEMEKYVAFPTTLRYSPPHEGASLILAGLYEADE